MNEETEYPFIHGGLEKIFKLIEESLKVTLSLRGNKLIIQGQDETDIEKAEKLIDDIRIINKEGYIVKPEDIVHALHGLQENKEVSILSLFKGGIPVH